MRHAPEGCQHVRVAFITREDIEAVVRAAWARDTCDPVDADDWSAANPSRDQRGTTALVINDLLGGELPMAEVLGTDGSRQRVQALRAAQARSRAVPDTETPRSPRPRPDPGQRQSLTMTHPLLPRGACSLASR
jgi:hypothetical protein